MIGTKGSKVERMVGRVLRGLYGIDPALRGQEAELRKVIRNLIDAKPDARMDAAFERELKERLLSNFGGKEQRRASAIAALWAKPGVRAAIGLATAAGLALLVNTGIDSRRLADRAAEPAPIAASRPVDEIGRAGPAAASTPAAPAKAGAEKGRAVGGQPGAAAPASAGRAAEPRPLAASPLAQAAEADDSRLFAYRDGGERKKAEASSEAYLDTLYEEREAPIAPRAKDLSAVDALASGLPAQAPGKPSRAQDKPAPAFNTEEYDRVVENPWSDPVKEPLSTFSIDVDTASYANIRRFITSGSLPPPDAVRVEELVNYFSYDYPEPKDGEPLAFDTELATCPWSDGHYLLRIGVQAMRVAAADLPPTSLVFLIDVSGSMEESNKLPLVKESLKLLAGSMRKEDRISIIVYSGAAGLVLEPTPGSRHEAIFEAIDSLEAGGSTAGGEGIELAYAVAADAFIKGGNNRVILATDGDFNVGASSDGALVRLIEEKRKGGVFLSVLGFGMGNYKDSKMQKLADSGNGNYAYIDTLEEARKVLERQMAGTLYTLAKDVKLQLEFNPATVSSYRLIGYEKRVLAARDFDDDAKDAGELGAGHTVTALYELIPATGAASPRSDLKYQKTVIDPAAAGGDLMTIKFRYKRPDGDVSKLVERAVPWKPVPFRQASADTRFAAAVAAWGSLLRGSEYKGGASFALVEDLATGARGKDADGYRADFVKLVRDSRRLAEGR